MKTRNVTIDALEEQPESSGENSSYASSRDEQLGVHDDATAVATSVPVAACSVAVPAAPALVANANTPSSQYEATICRQLWDLVETCQSTWARSFDHKRIALRGFLFEQSVAVVVTCIMLIISCILYPVTQTIVCTTFFFVVYACCAVLQSYLFWARVTEGRYHAVNVMTEVINRWSTRIAEMPTWNSQTPQERRRVFLECFAHLPAKAFRMVAVVDERTYRLKHIQKSLMVKRCKRLDEATLRVRRYMEPTNICKLVDVMHITVERDAIALKPLTDKARPPRLPNLLIARTKFVEQEETTDESDGERESRTELGGGNAISVSQHMEFFVHRTFLLLWISGMVLTIGAGLLFRIFKGVPLGEGVFLEPCVALLGLLPVNAIVLHRILLLYANVYLDKLFHFVVAKRTHTFDDRLPRFPFLSTLTMAARVLLRRQPSNNSRNPLVLSTSLVDSFGMATVIAMLDKTGIVTDMVLLPVRVLLLRANARGNIESTSSEEDEAFVVGGLTEAKEKDARERQRDMRKQIKRKKFQAERFVELLLDPSAREQLAVDFADKKQLTRHQTHLNPLCLCILLHATTAEPANLETWTEPFRFCDHTSRWSRALHWIPRACSFSDSVGTGYLVLARILLIDTKMQSGHRNSSAELACALLVEASDGSLHVFTLGTPFMVTEHCNSHWAGTSVEQLQPEEKAEIVFMGKHQWEEGMCFETVALSHRVLPERYRGYVAALRRNREGDDGGGASSSGSGSGAQFAEFFFRDGEDVTSTTARSRWKHRGRSSAPGPSAAAASRASVSGSTRGGDPLLRDVVAASVASAGAVSRGDSSRFNDDDDHGNDDDRSDGSSSLPSLKAGSAPCSPRGSFTGSAAIAAPQRPRGLRRRVSFDDVPSERGNGSFAEDDILTTRTFIKLMVTTGHTFLGLAGVRDSVRPDVQTAMSMLDGAGVRCMFFCPDNERQTKSFGSRVGLETDWNCCISLKEDAVALDPHSIRAQLPFGIKSIRKHILHVDPIPLQVNLFSHAQGVSTRAMLSILQDNHEVVVAVGSAFNHSNVRSFVQADLALAVLPTRRGVNADKDGLLGHGRIVEPSDFAASGSVNRDLPLYRNVAELIASSCALRAPPNTSILPVVATMVRQARLRLSGIGNCVEFIMHANFFLVALNTIALMTSAPLLLNPTMTVIELNVIIPVLSLSCTYTAYAGIDSMQTMPSRHNFFVRLSIFKHSALVWCLRYLPSLVTLLALGITAAQHTCVVGLLELRDKTTNQCMSAAQGYTALTFNYWLMVHCWTHMSRHHPITWSFSIRLGHGRRATFLFRSARWILVSAAATLLSILLTLAETPVSALPDAFFPSVAHFTMALVFPVVLLLFDVPIKRWREKRFSNMQKFRKLMFGTRLGMHSPRGDYEPEGATFNNPQGDFAATATTTGAAADVVSTTNESGAVGERVGVAKRISEWFFRYTTMRGGQSDLNCVCCDHFGGNYASYHVTANI